MMESRKLTANFFVEAKSEEDAIEYISNCIQLYTEEYVLKSIEEYWKIRGTYVVRFTIKVEKDNLPLFLDSLSDVWEEYGCPKTDELLASRNNINCKYIKEKISLINIFLDEINDDPVI